MTKQLKKMLTTVHFSNKYCPLEFILILNNKTIPPAHFLSQSWAKDANSGLIGQQPIYSRASPFLLLWHLDKWEELQNQHRRMAGHITRCPPSFITNIKINQRVWSKQSPLRLSSWPGTGTTQNWLLLLLFVCLRMERCYLLLKECVWKDLCGHKSHKQSSFRQAEKQSITYKQEEGDSMLPLLPY